MYATVDLPDLGDAIVDTANQAAADSSFETFEMDREEGNVIRVALSTGLLGPEPKPIEYGVAEAICRESTAFFHHTLQAVHAKLLSRGIPGFDDPIGEKDNSVATLKRERDFRVV